tara:strand:- start:259 stop:807 length:549 start_codon:yes stop_codon:yes gene_type:complete
MTAIAGRLGEFWAEFNASPPDASVTPGATAGINNPTDSTLSAFVEACGSLVDVSISGNVDELETTVHNDDSFSTGGAGSSPVHGTARTYIPNFHDETADVSMRYDEGDACQEAMLICAFGSFLYHFWYIPKGEEVNAGGQKVIWGDCFATSFSPSSPLDDVTSVDFSLRLSGTDYAEMDPAT